MKLSKLTYGVWVILCFVCYSCQKDNTNTDLVTLPSVKIDTTGVQTSFEVQQGVNEISIDPKIVSDANTNLTYLWRIYSTTGLSDTLDNKKAFKQVIKKVPGTYTLEFQAKQNNGLSSFMRYNVKVVKQLEYGWVVAYETPEGATDVGFFRTPEIVKSISNDFVLTDLYKKANGAALPGSPVAIAISGNNNYLYSTKEAVGIYTSDYSKIVSFSQLFGGDPPTPHIQGIFGSGSYQLINNGTVYFMYSNLYLGEVVVDAKGYQVETGGGITYTGARSGVFFDVLNKRFIGLGQFSNQGTTFANANANARFNLNNLNKRLLYGDQAETGNPFNSKKVTIFEEFDKSKRWLLGIDFATAATPDMFMIDMAAMPNILDAKYFDISNLGPATSPIGYYATDNQVYNYNYSASNNSILYTRAGFTAPTGEVITAMKLFKDMGSGYTTADTRTNRILFIATWNASTNNGKVYLIGVNATSGDMVTTPMKVVEGFGKIKDMTLKPS